MQKFLFNINYGTCCRDATKLNEKKMHSKYFGDFICIGNMKLHEQQFNFCSLSKHFKNKIILEHTSLSKQIYMLCICSRKCFHLVLLLTYFVFHLTPLHTFIVSTKLDDKFCWQSILSLNKRVCEISLLFIFSRPSKQK